MYMLHLPAPGDMAMEAPYENSGRKENIADTDAENRRPADGTLSPKDPGRSDATAKSGQAAKPSATAADNGT